MAEELLVASIDQGTSSSRALLFSTVTGSIVASHQIPLTPTYPVPGWIEMDAEVIYSTTLECLNNCVDQLIAKGGRVDQIVAIGITNQRETTIAWDKRTGKPLAPAIVWSDARTADLVKQFTQVTPTKSANHFQKKTGLSIHSYFSALKICWLLKNVSAVSEAAHDGFLCTGTVDCWLIWCLTTGKAHVTDVTNASRTLLFNLNTLTWDDELCKFFQIDKRILPGIVSSTEVVGRISDPQCKMSGVKIAGILGDQQASLVGQTWGMDLPGNDVDTRGPTVKVTFGTGAFMLWNIGKTPYFSDNGIITTIAYRMGKDAPYYALEGAVAFSGATMNWLKKKMNMFSDYDELERMVRRVYDNSKPNLPDPCYLVPAFSGLFCPWWQESARALFAGITADVDRDGLVYAGLRSSAYQTSDVIQVATMARGDQGQHARGLAKPREIVIDGGLANSEVFVQSLADILNMTVRRHYNFHFMSALGAAVFAVLGVGGIDPVNGLLNARNYPTGDKTISAFRPIVEPSTRTIRMFGWHAALERSLAWTDSSNPMDEDSLARLLRRLQTGPTLPTVYKSSDTVEPELPKKVNAIEVSLGKLILLLGASVVFGVALSHLK